MSYAFHLGSNDLTELSYMCIYIIHYHDQTEEDVFFFFF